MKGLVEITRVYKDGTKELVCRDNNIITDGMGVVLGNIFTDTGSTNIKDHLIGYFQVGTGRLNPAGQDISKAKYISTLQSPVTTEDLYGKDSEVIVDTHQLVQYHPNNFVPSYQESWVDGVFAEIPDSNSTKVIDGVVHYRFTITENMLNDLGSDLSEFGLFVRDINSNARDDQSVLVAYKNFADGSGIAKNKEFALTVDWKLKLSDDALSSQDNPITSNKPNVVFIMLDDVGVDHLGLYDDINPIDLTNAANPNARPVSQREDNTNGKNIYPHMPALSAIAANGMTMYNVRAQPACSPTRATLLTGKYNGSTKNYGTTEKGYWGPGIGIVPSFPARTRGGLRGLNDMYGAFYDEDGELANLYNQVSGADGVPNQIAFQYLIGDHCRDKLGYKSALFGKWHLGAWSEQRVYCEEVGGVQLKKFGRGWDHLKLKGRWDHYCATFSNLNADTIPGRSYGGVWDDNDGWPNFDGSTFEIKGQEMGFVNYFVSERIPATAENDFQESYLLTTVSDTGYTTFAQAASGGNIRQGDPSSFTTNYILSAASSYFNSAEEPFFMYISPNVPHTPYTYPPSGGVYTSFYNNNNKHVILKNAGAAGKAHTTNQTSANWITTNAMLENFDFQLSAFLKGLTETKKANTIFIVTSDNGAVGADLGRRAAYASSIGLGYKGALVGGNYVGSGGLGATYDKMLNLGAYCSGLGSGGAHVGDTSGARRGGESDSANQFKASLYDRGMLVPMVVSGVGVQSNVQSSAMIDLVDLVATLTDIAGADPNAVPEVPVDSISFYDVLTGKTDASSHARQWSYGEVFFPNGNSFGPLDQWGPYSGFINCGEDEVEGSTSEKPIPTIPRRRRQALTIRFKPDDFIGNTPAQTTPTLNYLRANGDITEEQYETIRDNYVVNEKIPDVSGGLWKIIKPSSGRISGVGADFDRQDFPDPDDSSDTTPFTQNKGAWFEELYHLQSTNFSAVDLYELNDYIREYNKGVTNNHIASSLIVSAIKLPEAQGGINNGAANGGVLDNTVHYWNLARIFDTAHRCMVGWNSRRTTPPQTINQLNLNLTSDEDDSDYSAPT